VSGVEAAKQALAIKAEPTGSRTIREELVRMKPEIEKVIPRQIGVERFTRLVLTELRRNPQLMNCKPHSVLGAMMLCAQLGLEPGPLGHAYLVPYRNECTFVLGYRGMIELASRSGRLRSIVARPVYEGDEWAYSYGITDKLHHVPCDPSQRGPVRMYYGLARFANPSGYYLHVMQPDEIEAYRRRSASGRDGKGPWSTDYDQMACKTVVRRMQPYLPSSVHLARAIELDEQIVEGFTEEGVTFDADLEDMSPDLEMES
jgi:recombination protein RecT